MTMSGMIKDEVLIAEVRNFPSLYDTKHRDYKDAKVRSHAWHQIARSLDVTVTECHTRWKSLRDRYVREKKSQSTGGAAQDGGQPGASSRRPWNLGPSLAFLDDHVRKRRSRADMELISRVPCIMTVQPKRQMLSPPPSEVSQSSTLSSPIILPDHTAHSYSPMFDQRESMAQSPSPVPEESTYNASSSANNASRHNNRVISGLRRRTKRDLFEAGLLKILDEEQDLDEDDHFCASMAHAIKSLLPQKRALVKLQIHQLIYDAQFNS